MSSEEINFQYVEEFCAQIFSLQFIDNFRVSFKFLYIIIAHMVGCYKLF